jgi:hypothetical protein
MNRLLAGGVVFCSESGMILSANISIIPLPANSDFLIIAKYVGHLSVMLEKCREKSENLYKKIIP